MNITKLTTYFDAGDAAAVIDFLDIAREALWETYGEQIIQMHREAAEHRKQPPRECRFDDEADF